MNEFIYTILDKNNGLTEGGHWQTVFSDNTHHFMPCICGHKVKRITYIYHRPTKTIGYIGKTCIKKYGIQTKVSNAILLAVIKENVSGFDGSTRIDALVRKHIVDKYSIFMTKIQDYIQEDIEIDYYDIVAPFRRLLNDVCDLVSEYEFDLVNLLREIERGVESMNQTTKHTMVDENDLSEGSLSDVQDVSVSDSGMETREETCEEAHEDILEETHEETREETCEEICEETHEETREETHEEAHEDILEEAHEETCEETHEEAHQDTIDENHAEIHQEIHEETSHEICEKVLEEIIDFIQMDHSIKLINNDDVRSEISIGSFHEIVEDVLDGCQEEPIVIDESDEMYEDDFEEESNEYSIDSIGQIQEQQNEKQNEHQKEQQNEQNIFIKHETIDLNIMPDPCFCTNNCYCIFKYRLWKVRQELNKHKDTIENIRFQTALLVKNTKIFREKMRKRLE